MRGWWLKLSIRRKILFFTSLILIFSILLSFFSIAMLERYMDDFNYVLEDSYHVNKVLVQFEQEQNAFQQYANYRSNEQKNAYQSLKAQTNQSIDNLRFKYNEMGVERFLLTQAIRNAYSTYNEYCENAISLNRESDTYIKTFYSATKVGTYLDSYIRNLMEETLNEGNDLYYQKVEAYKILPRILFILVAFVIAMAVFLWRLTSKHIVRPVLDLADSARRITAGDFEQPDVTVDNQDEIGDLTFAFNNMRHSMSSFIASLHEKGEIEALLHKEELQRFNAEASLQKLQISLLQSQINPHFLFNTLNTISNMAKLENAPDTKELILRLSNLFRYNLQSTDESVTLTRELQIIKDYMYIQYRRFGNRLKLELDCRVDSDKIMIPTFTLQPIVENAVIHGISPCEQGGLIRIRIFERSEIINIFVSDNGIGITEAKLNALTNAQSNKQGHISGIGIGNVKKRLELIYPGSSFKVYSKIGFGTIVWIKLPKAMDINKEV